VRAVVKLAPSVGSLPDANSYLELFDYNVGTLAQALSARIELSDHGGGRFSHSRRCRSRRLSSSPGSTTWFGLQVLRRNVVFADLALAQVSALGATVAVGRRARGSEPRRPMPIRSLSRRPAPCC